MVEQRDIDIIFESPIDWAAFRGKTVLVTGATGRLGMYLVEALAHADIEWNLDLRVIAVARSAEKLQRVFGETLGLPNVRTIVQDITEPFDDLAPVDFIFHTAGLASPRDFTDTPVDTLWGHVAGTRNVLELARKQAHCHVFYVSTVEIYGNWESDAKITEADMGPIIANRARACYPEAKRLCETMLASYAAQYGVNYNGVRLCHTFGPGIALDDGRAFAEFLRDVVRGEDIVLQSDGSAMRTYTYVADAVGAMFLIVTSGDPGAFYNVANVRNLVSIRDLAGLIASLDPAQKVNVRFANEQSKLQYLPFHLAIMDTSKIEALGWQPRVGLKKAFQYTLEYLLQNGRDA
ncbi:MAG: NAD-dependent epimerase/dehydratase family protein [Clostridiales bacterium]|uniref:NAD-dependent epimerase/dehydratase family protein n=1 Tax=Selenomonas sp. TaxID=2053611 RepID=UPI0025EBB175|nr:NAD-dependent epimerase/dehydratase family protein [Selenomonas sp.]MCI6085711.1 NAD-dependent epimerase/dehydratase family protein [Selenomonas sp.]MCI6760586.1 NAD-dependent epimerase/dehydratase family protein [Clostridiales bacterium]